MADLVLTRIHYLSGDECGYCHCEKKYPQALQSERTQEGVCESITIGMSVQQMTCQHYDEFINQGFRRSGSFLYKPDLLRSCCKMYTIRTRMEQLKLSKQHRKVVNRFIKAITDESMANPHNKPFQLKNLIEAEKASKTFKTRFEPSKFSREKFELYKKYQVKVHNDKPEDISELSFKRFLCETPFLEKEIEGDKNQWDLLNNWVTNWPNKSVTTKRIGPTHECYYLDDKLIAISILDFLPSGLSSIYFIWDPDYAHLSLGTLSGLREIQMCQELKLGYYYLGYYIEDCPKMNYKGKFGGEILDLCNEVYVPLTEIEQFIADGKLFVLGTSSDSSVYREPEMENNGQPLLFEESDLHKEKVIDLSESIYAKQANTYSEAERAYHILKQRLNLIQPPSSTYRLPLVVPGLMPMWQVLEWVDQGIVDGDLPVYIFEIMSTRMVERSFEHLSGEYRQLVIDTIRVIGLEKFQNCIIII